MSKALVCSLIFVAGVTSLSAAAAPVLSRYRDVALGDSVATVMERLQLESSAAKVLADHPSLVQEVTWRPHRFVSGTSAPRDPLAEMVLTFHFGRLARIVAIYDRDRVQGLTDSDLLELLSGVYGVAVLPSTSTRGLLGAISSRHTIGEWADADTRLLLWREDYPRRVGLTISAIAAEPALLAAIDEGARRSAEGEPQRERDRQAAAATAIKERDARIRLENKTTFKP